MSESRRLVARTAAIASIAVLALVVVAPVVTSWRPSGVARAATPADPVHGITVQGTGKITLTPDLARINVGVTFQGATAAKAQGGASTGMARIIAAIKATGIADADLASQWVSLQPQYDYSSQGSVPPRVIGFQANQSLSIKVHKIETSGDVIDAAVGAGATDVGGISFSVSDPAAATAQARTCGHHRRQDAGEVPGRCGRCLAGRGDLDHRGQLAVGRPVSLPRQERCRRRAEQPDSNPGRHDRG